MEKCKEKVTLLLLSDITSNMTVISKRSTITFKEIVQLSKGSLTNVLDQQGL